MKTKNLLDYFNKKSINNTLSNNKENVEGEKVEKMEAMIGVAGDQGVGYTPININIKNFKNFLFSYAKGLCLYNEYLKEKLEGYELSKNLDIDIYFQFQNVKGSYIKINDKGRLSSKEFLDYYEDLKSNMFLSAIHSTKFINHIVLEIDEEDPIKSQKIYKDLFMWLDNLKWKYLPVWTGNKSIHIHVFFKIKDEKDLQAMSDLRNLLPMWLTQHFPKLDIQVTKITTLCRLPFSYHHKSKKFAEILLCNYTKDVYDIIYSEKGPDWLNSKKFVNFLKSLENDIPYTKLEALKIVLNKTDKPNEDTLIKETPPQNKQQWDEYKKHKKQYKYNYLYKLQELYYKILSTPIQDGRDRVLMILYTIANTLNIPPQEFENQITTWAEACKWKSYRYSYYIDIYKRGIKKYWSNNWRWAIKNFLLSQDIDKVEYTKIYTIIEEMFPQLVEKYLGKKDI